MSSDAQTTRYINKLKKRIQRKQEQSSDGNNNLPQILKINRLESLDKSPYSKQSDSKSQSTMRTYNLGVLPQEYQVNSNIASQSRIDETFSRLFDSRNPLQLKKHSLQDIKNAQFHKNRHILKESMAQQEFQKQQTERKRVLEVLKQHSVKDAQKKDQFEPVRQLTNKRIENPQITNSEVMKQLERDLEQMINQDKFHALKIKANAAGGPIDKYELKVSQFDIVRAYEKLAQMNTDRSVQSDANSLQPQRIELEDIKRTLIAINQPQMSRQDIHQIQSQAQLMRENVYFQKFMLKHERTLDKALQEIGQSVTSTNDKQPMMDQQAFEKSAIYKSKLSRFLDDRNIYRNLNKSLFKDLSLLEQTKALKAFQVSKDTLLDNNKIEQIIKHNSRSPEKMRTYEKYDGKRQLLTSREKSKLKERSYGAWYLKPADFNQKVSKLNVKLQRLDKAIGI